MNERSYPTATPPRVFSGTDVERIAFVTTGLPPFSKWLINGTTNAYVWNGATWDGPFTAQVLI